MWQSSKYSYSDQYHRNQRQKSKQTGLESGCLEMGVGLGPCARSCYSPSQAGLPTGPPSSTKTVPFCPPPTLPNPEPAKPDWPNLDAVRPRTWCWEASTHPWADLPSLWVIANTLYGAFGTLLEPSQETFASPAQALDCALNQAENGKKCLCVVDLMAAMNLPYCD